MFLGQEVQYYMVYIAYYNEINLQICNYTQKNALVTKIANTRLTKTKVAIFALAKRLPTSATLDRRCACAGKAILAKEHDLS